MNFGILFRQNLLGHPVFTKYNIALDLLEQTWLFWKKTWEFLTSFALQTFFNDFKNQNKENLKKSIFFFLKKIK